MRRLLRGPLLPLAIMLLVVALVESVWALWHQDVSGVMPTLLFWAIGGALLVLSD